MLNHGEYRRLTDRSVVRRWLVVAAASFALMFVGGTAAHADGVIDGVLDPEPIGACVDVNQPEFDPDPICVLVTPP